jgi:hypothetical protein
LVDEISFIAASQMAKYQFILLDLVQLKIPKNKLEQEDVDISEWPDKLGGSV